MQITLSSQCWDKQYYTAGGYNDQSLFMWLKPFFFQKKTVTVTAYNMLAGIVK